MCKVNFWHHLVKKYLREPTNREAKKEARAFSNISGFPRIIFAAIDGVLIKVNLIPIKISDFRTFENSMTYLTQ